MFQQAIDQAGARFFKFIHHNNLIYNTCWEDPHLDRQALQIQSTDRMLMITSAGCNALDYALENPREIHCIDVNPHQNALLDLKIVAIKNLDYDVFFEMFGNGRCLHFADLYENKLRPFLNPVSQNIWDQKQNYFTSTSWRPSFYFRGTSGLVAKIFNTYINQLKLRPFVNTIFEAESLNEQKRLYQAAFKSQLWTPLVKWLMSSDVALSMVGVPRPQRIQVEQKYPGGIAQFIEDCIEGVFTRLSLKDNYFWWLYLNGSYTRERCPEYLKENNFNKLKQGLVDKIETHTSTLFDYVHSSEQKFDKFILLDHMDWLSHNGFSMLEKEWQAFVDHANPNSRFIWRSGGMNTDYLQKVHVQFHGKEQSVTDLFHFDDELARKLHAQDRVNTYGSFYIAELKNAPPSGRMGLQTYHN